MSIIPASFPQRNVIRHNEAAGAVATLPYPHPRPAPPPQLYLLVTLACFGLTALFLAAFSAFKLVAAPPQAFFAATLIEAGLIVEALTLALRPRTAAPWIGLLISYTVSARYNIIQAAAAAPQLDPFSLYALSLGPLSALAFVSLTLGGELRRYQSDLSAWQEAAAAWLNEKTANEAAYHRQIEDEERQYRRKQDELSRKRAERRELPPSFAELPPSFAERSALFTEPTDDEPMSAELPADYAELLAIVRERSAGQPFGPADVQQWLNKGKTTAYQFLNDALKTGDLRRLERGRYALH